MKRLFAAILALPALALAATTTPVQLLSPTGSTAGQAIVSNGPSSAPTWQAVPLTGVTGVLPIANGGTNASTAAAARTNLGVPSTGANTFSGSQAVALSNPFITLNDTAGSQAANVEFKSNGTTFWTVTKSAANNFNISRYVAGAFTDNPISCTTATGVCTLSQRPVFGSATPWDSANLASPASTTGNLGQFASTTSAQLATVISNETGSGALVFGTSPTIGTATINTPTISGGKIDNASVGATTASTGRFTTITATTGGASITGGLTVASGGANLTGGLTMSSGAITPVSTAGITGTTTNDNVTAGGVGEYLTASSATTAMTSNVGANCTSISLTAGDWDVSGVVTFTPAGTTTFGAAVAGTSTTSASQGPAGTFQRFVLSFTTGGGASIQAPTTRYSLSATTTVYLVGVAQFGVSTMTCDGFIRARRVR